MSIDLKTLCLRENQRRRQLWTLERLRPGSEEAKPLLAELSNIDHQDLENPIGDAYSMSVDELRERVPESEFLGSDGHTFVIVLDRYIPSPGTRDSKQHPLSLHDCRKVVMQVTGVGFYDAGYEICSTLPCIESAAIWIDFEYKRPRGIESPLVLLRQYEGSYR